MKDKQVPPSGTEPRIPVVSAALHCISMTALVYFRSSFGFAYLSPKSVFFAFSWVLVLFTVFAWNEPSVWFEYRAVCLFGLVAALLYWTHLLTSFLRELYVKGEHDHYSGRSHPIRFLQRAGRVPAANFEMNLHLWIEPAGIVLAALALRFIFGERHLSNWLLLVALCLWFKEAFNYWHQLRQRKRQGDIFEDAGDTVDPASPDRSGNHAPPKPTRKARVVRGRSPVPLPDVPGEKRAAELLRLLPPYSLEQAEENFRCLIKVNHPDANDGSPESVEQSAELNAAIKYFRERLRV